MQSPLTLRHAEYLDKVLELVIQDLEEGQAYHQWYLQSLQDELKTDRDTLEYLLGEHTDILEIGTRSYMLGEYSGSVQPTLKGKTLYKNGFRYVTQLKEKEDAERKADSQATRGIWARRLNWALGTALAVATVYVGYREKIHDEKEVVWEKRQLQLENQVSEMDKILKAIPDSIKLKYK
jgi:hypothetical protein